MQKHAVVLSMLALVAAATACSGQLSSTFDTSNENWRVATLSQPFNSGAGPAYPGTVVVAPFLGLLGNPAGSIGYQTDPGDYQYFLTPSAWNGNLGSYMNGTITWQYRWTTSAGTWNNGWGDIAIRDTVNNRWIVADVTSVVPPQNVWNSFSVNLNTTGGWRIGSTGGALATDAQILAALQNMGGVFIRGEAVTGTVETYQLDNFRWTTPVPEAGTMASFGAFLSMGLFWLRRRVTS
ncbi:MAG: hypothetical protein GX446_03000 [Chthonomonadales bacterium]|nr:hypothetical protein [Chthonomonadales bacterium]